MWVWLLVFLNLVLDGGGRFCHFISAVYFPVPIKYKAVWAPEPVRTVYTSAKYLILSLPRFFSHPGSSVETAPPELSVINL